MCYHCGNPRHKKKYSRVKMVRAMLLPNLMISFIIVISMDIKNLSVDPSLLSHLRSIHLMATTICAKKLDTGIKIVDHGWTLTRNWGKGYGQGNFHRKNAVD